jgi:hypothetical protein
LGDRGAVLGAVDPEGVGLQVAHQGAEVQCPPVPAPFSLVVAGSTTPAPATQSFRRASRTDVDHHGIGLLVEVDRLDHCLSVDTEDPAPYVYTEHAILLALFPNR